jgi:hypothetical protein
LLYALQLAEADEHQSARRRVQITADLACAAGAGSQCQIELMNANRSLMEDAAELGIVGDLMLSIEEIQNSGKTQPLATRLWFDATGDGILDLYIIRAHRPNQLFRGGDSSVAGGYVEDLTSPLVVLPRHSADSRAGLLFDATGDGREDLCIINYGEPNQLIKRDLTADGGWR